LMAHSVIAGAGREIMFATLKFGGALVALICIAVGATTLNASAETVEVAKKCAALMQKAFPPREVGNPAAGSAKGNGQAEQDFYKKCIANNGNVSEDAPKDQK
jgi:hypothetical protein